MNAHEDRLFGLPCALDECHVLQPVARLAERNELEVAVFCGQFHFLSHLYEAFALQSVGNHVLYGDDFDSPFLRLLHQFGKPCHRSVLVHDFHQCCGGVESGQLAQVDGGLGVAASAQHAIVLGV